MSNWTPITADDLKSAGFGLIIDQAQTVSTGSVDPVAEEIKKAVDDVRRSCAIGNRIDADPSKVPNSLKGLTVRKAVYALMRRLMLPLSDDDKDQESRDEKKLNRIEDKPGRVEVPDNAQADGVSIQAQPSPRIQPRDRKFTDRSTDGV